MDRFYRDGDFVGGSYSEKKQTANATHGNNAIKYVVMPTRLKSPADALDMVLVFLLPVWILLAVYLPYRAFKLIAM